MSGLAGFASVSPSPASSIEEMLRRMTHYPWQCEVRHADQAGRASLGAVTFDRSIDGALATDDARGLAIVFDGELFDTDAERQRLRASSGEEIGAYDAALVLAGFRLEGPAFLARLNGEFSAVIWDASRQELHLITDRFGLRPLFVAHTGGACAAATEINALLAVPGIDTRWSEIGVAQFFAFGYFFNDDTLLRGVRAVPAATCGTYRVVDGSYVEHAYWRLQPSVAQAQPQELTERFGDVFVRAVERRARAGEYLGLSLSGGLDARTILGVMPANRDLNTVSLGIEGSLDHRSAAKLASIAGVPHRAFTLDQRFLGQFETHLREMVALTSGHYLDQGIVMVTLPIYRELGIEHLMRGHGGELLHMTKAYAFSLTDDAMRASEPQLRSWLLAHLTDYMLGGVPDDLFTIDLRAGAATSLDRAIARCSPVERPVDRVWQLFLNERLHRETTLSMHVFEQFAGIRQPYLDNDVIDTLFAMPASMKLGDDLQTSLLHRVRPAFLDVVNSNTGARLGAGPLETTLAKLRLKVGAKLGLKGYQPYERLGLWLKRELRDLVETTLSSEQFLSSGLFRPDVIRRTIQQHMDGQANHTFLLMSLVIFGVGIETRNAM
jgi:asparagine synthase (glutamine-hydrolysing)